MKTRLLFFASLLALTGCGSSMSDITPGDKVEKASFENAFLVRNILLHSNYHVDITYKQYNTPAEGHTSYSKSIDFDSKKAKVIYTSDKKPYYFDFSSSNDSSSYTFDFYSPFVYNNEVSYSVKSYKNISLSNDFMGINDLDMETGGKGLVLISGLNHSSFKLNGGIYELTSPIKVDRGEAKATYDVIKVSFFGDNPKEIYYHYDIEITVEEQTLKMSAESRLVFSKHGQVSVTLPEIEADPQ